MSDNDFDVLNGKLDKILGLLSERSKDVITKEMGGENSRDSSMEGGESIHIASPNDSKPPIVSEHVSGVNLEDNTENFSVKIEYQGRTYEKFKPCKFKCGGLTAWAKDYKQGDKMLHVHPTDREILGFSQKGLDDQWHCPVVLKK